jgi:hypothetical protein
MQAYEYEILRTAVAITLEPRFTNSVRSWMPFVTRNVRKPKLLWSHCVLFNNILKNHKTQWNSREVTANSSRDVYWAKVIHQLTLSRRYSQLVTNRCCRIACSLLETPFVTRDFFFGKFVREPRFHRTSLQGDIMIRMPSRLCAVCDVSFKVTCVGVCNSLQLTCIPYRAPTCYLRLDGS